MMKSGRHYKIGRTNSLGRRGSELAIKIPVSPKTIHTIETDDPVGVEAYWHRRFAEKRGEGEWFDLSIDDVRAFKRWKRIG
ncbi:MAG: GIY-YIG nuclease family protein [Pyrinomonadaceae bacterium]